MFKRILVAVDASETSDQALQAAIRLATEQEAGLRIMHVVDAANINLGTEFPAATGVLERLTQNGQAMLDKAEASATAAGVTAETTLVKIEALNQRVSEALVQEAETWGADLIVLGTHGRRGLSRLFLGSVAEGTVRLASRPVLLIPGK